MKKRIGLGLLVTATLVLLAALLSSLLAKPTAVATRGPLADRLLLRALVVAADGVAEVSGPATGRVRRVLVRAGDKVTAGQLLAEISDLGPGASADASRVEAPVAGTVLARHVDAGDSLAALTLGGRVALFEIADLARTEVHAEVEERDAGRVLAGQAARITGPGGRRTIGSGVVARVGSRIERRTIGADDARVRADGAVQPLWISWQGVPPAAPIGQRVEAEIRLPERPVATRVPREAVVVRNGRTVVDTPALLLFTREIEVKVAAADGALAEVTGIAPGTRVVLH